MTPKAKPDPTPSTRDKLIDAAFAVVAREGFDKASVKEIAKEAGLAPGLLHYHFATRDALLEAALRKSLAAYQDESRRRRAANPQNRQLDAYFASARAASISDKDFFRVRLAFAAKALAEPALASVLRELNLAAAEEMALTFAAARGANRPTARERALAATLKAAFDGIMLAWLNDPAFPISEAGKTLEQTVRAALQA
jgi:AcrR family transcriptional regulator